MRVICEFMAYAEPSLLKIVNAIFAGEVAEDIDALTDAMHVVAREARTIEGRLSKEQWIVGANYSATDMVIFPWIQVLRRALDKSAAAELGTRFLPMERNYPALARWITGSRRFRGTSGRIRLTGGKASRRVGPGGRGSRRATRKTVARRLPSPQALRWAASVTER